MNRVQVIIKVAERCNIACDYCYYFFGGDESYKKRPPYLSPDKAEEVAELLRQGAIDLTLTQMDIVFHGGEPLMIGKARFNEYCDLFKRVVGPVTDLKLSTQTNGMLIDDEWVSLFSKHGVSVGISLDGTPDINDKHRIDKRGRGTHSRVVKGLEALKTGYANGSGVEPAILTVINPSADQNEVLSHFCNELGVKNIGYLLPDMSYAHGEFDVEMTDGVGRALTAMIGFVHRNHDVRIRELDDFYAHFQALKAPVGGGGPTEFSNQIVVIQSDGTLSIDDSYMPTGAWRARAPVRSLREISLSAWLDQPIYQEIRMAQASLPDGCRDCVWAKICRGGDLENRFSEEDGFNNPSIYCEALQTMYAAASVQLVEQGYPRERILETLAPAQNMLVD